MFDKPLNIRLSRPKGQKIKLGIIYFKQDVKTDYHFSYFKKCLLSAYEERDKEFVG